MKRKAKSLNASFQQQEEDIKILACGGIHQIEREDSLQELSEVMSRTMSHQEEDQVERKKTEDIETHFYPIGLGVLDDEEEPEWGNDDNLLDLERENIESPSKNNDN